MERKLHHEPIFDIEMLHQKCALWKSNGISSAILEWSTGNGPSVFYYPLGERRFGVKWIVAVETTHYNETYADYLEHTLLPRLRDEVRSAGLQPTIICVDLQPLQVQRQRRRQIERVQAAAHESLPSLA